MLKALTDLRFRELIDRRGISFTGCDGALHAIALGLGELTQLPFDCSIIAVIEGMFREGLGHYTLTPGSDSEVLAATAASAVFGAARSWFLNPKRIFAEVMAAKIAGSGDANLSSVQLS